MAPTYKELLEQEGAVNVAEKNKQTDPSQDTQTTDKNNQTGEGGTNAEDTSQKDQTQTDQNHTDQNANNTDTDAGKEGKQTDQTQKETTQTTTDTKEKETTQKEGGEEGENKQPGESDILQALNSSLQTEFKSVNDIKELLDTKNQYQQAQNELEQYKSRLQEKDEVIQQIGNPFNEMDGNLVKAHEITKNNPGLPASVALQIASGDFDNMDDDDVLVLDEIRNDPKKANWSREDILDKINDENGLYDFDDIEDEEELTEKQKKRLNARKKRKASEANMARDEFKKMADIKPPEQKNKEEEIRQQREQRANQFQPVADKMVKEKLDKVEVEIKGKDNFEYDIDDDFKNWLTGYEKDNQGNPQQFNRLTQYLAANYNPDDPNSYDQAVSDLKELYLRKNGPKIRGDLVKSVETRMQEQFDREQHNTKGKNYQERTTEGDIDRKNRESEEEAMKRVRGGV